MLKVLKVGFIILYFMGAVAYGVERAIEVKIEGGTHNEEDGTTTYVLRPLTPSEFFAAGYYSVIVECETPTERLIMTPIMRAVVHVDVCGTMSLILFEQSIGTMPENVRYSVIIDDEQMRDDAICADEPQLLRDVCTVRRLSSGRQFISVVRRMDGPVSWMPAPYRLDAMTVKRLSEGCNIGGVKVPTVIKEGSDGSSTTPSTSPEEVPVYDTGEGCVAPYPSPEDAAAAPSATATTTVTSSDDDAERAPAVYSWDGQILTRLAFLNVYHARSRGEDAPGSDPLSRRSVQRLEDRVERAQEVLPPRTRSSGGRSPSMDRLNERRRGKERHKARREKESWRSDSDEGLIVPNSVLRPAVRMIEVAEVIEEDAETAAAEPMAAAAPRVVEEERNATQDDLPPMPESLRRLFNGNLPWQPDGAPKESK